MCKSAKLSIHCRHCSFELEPLTFLIWLIPCGLIKEIKPNQAFTTQDNVTVKKQPKRLYFLRLVHFLKWRIVFFNLIFAREFCIICCLSHIPPLHVFRYVGADLTQEESAEWETFGRCQNSGLHPHHCPDRSKISLWASAPEHLM